MPEITPEFMTAEKWTELLLSAGATEYDLDTVALIVYQGPLVIDHNARLLVVVTAGHVENFNAVWPEVQERIRNA